MKTQAKSARANGKTVLFAAGLITVGVVGGVVALSRTGGRGATQTPRGEAREGWRYLFPSPQRNTLQSVWGNGRNVITVGRLGTVVVSRDQGLTWAVRPSGVTEDLQSVWGDGHGVLVAVGNNGAIVRSEDWGQHWTARPRLTVPEPAADADAGAAAAQQLAGRGTLTELCGDAQTGELYASGRMGVVARSTDRGMSWQVLNTGVTEDLYAVHCGAAGTAYVSGRGGYVLRTQDHGTTWTPFVHGSAATILSIYGSARELVAVGWFGTILTSTDQGQHWTSSIAPTTEDLSTVTSFADGTLAAVGARGTLVVRRNGAWAAQATGATESLHALWSDGTTAIGVGTEGLIYRTPTQGTAPWDARTTRVQGTVLAVTGMNHVRIAVGRAGMVLRSENDGRTFQKYTAAGGADLTSVFAISEQELYCTNNDNKILHSTDGGRTFSLVTGPGRERSVSGVWASGPDDVYVAGSGGMLLHSTDRGRTFTELNSGVSEDFFSVWGLNAQEVFAVGTRGFIVRSTDRGVSWQRMINMSTRDLTGMSGDPSGKLFATGKVGELLVSQDHGVHWRIARAGLPPTSSMFGACTTGRVWYAAGLGATLVRSTDQGATWTRESPFTEDDLVSIWCDRTDRPILGAYAGAVLERAPLE
ncbi:MAG: YCF48-related protein [Deltaproteobacteria bacterium]|nr:YCF48-related protein [Deltaproteobacteria bacterium]